MTFLRIALSCPLSQLFDYRSRPGQTALPGMRARVPFGRRSLVGLVMALAEDSDCPAEKLKTVQEVLDPEPLFSPELLELIRQAARYYHHPIGEVAATALPGPLLKGVAATVTGQPFWEITPVGRTADLDGLAKRAPRQAEILEFLRNRDQAVSSTELLAEWKGATPVLKTLRDKGLAVSAQRLLAAQPAAAGEAPLALNPEQAQAVDQVIASLPDFQPFLLDGVTGSGKTEVYLQIIAETLARGRQALVLVPEINLSPQMLARFQRRFATPIAVLHSRLPERERLNAWLLAREGQAGVVIGTRLAVWTPLARPGVIVVDEEHDASYKQASGLLYSARDMAVLRARLERIPVVLGSATPALESLHNAQQGRYVHLPLRQRAGEAKLPDFRVIDMRPHGMTPISPPLRKALTACLEQGRQALIFINRRGYAPAFMCHACGWIADCAHCDAYLTYHDQDRLLQCHHCGHQAHPPANCPQCGHPGLDLVGFGTERIELALRAGFPEARIVRVDSDNTRQRHAMEALLARINQGEADILVGTQMLAKGHHFPRVTLVGVINVDSGLFGIDFRASERLAQLLVQVAGRAGRAEAAGTVWLQTWHPDHPLLHRLLGQSYQAFAEAALDERRVAELPPFSHLALLRVEAKTPEAVTAFTDQVMPALQALPAVVAGQVLALGPVPAPMERKAGRHRAQVLIQARARNSLRETLAQWRPICAQVKRKSGLRWSLDVDPLDLF